MSKFMLIGGGEVGRGHTNYETKEIDKEIVKMVEKPKANFLFVGLASNFSDSYYDTMKKIYQDLGCQCAYLKKKNIINNPDIVKNKIETADIIYFCGGDTIKLIEDIKKYNLLPLLDKAIKNNTVIAGMSAGAIILCNKGYSDSLKLRGESEHYKFIKGFSFIPISICPHYEKGGQKAKELETAIKKTEEKIISLENGVALKIQDQKINIIKSNPNRYAYLCYNKNGVYQEKNLEKEIKNNDK